MLYRLKAIFKGNWKSFFKTINIVKEKTNKNKILIFFDILWCLVRYGAGHNDYKTFGFYDLTNKQRNTYITRFRSKKIITTLNDPAYSDYFDNKALFNEKFKEFLNRDTIDIEKVTLKEFEKFIKKHNTIFCKPYRGDSGKGIEKINTKDYVSTKELYDHIKENKIGVVEEAIIQHKDMEKVNSYAVNCIRVVTIIVNKKTYIVGAIVKFGTSKDYVDNMGRGMSVSGPVDLETGKILYDLRDMYGNVSSTHPRSKIKYQGYKIPMFKEVIDLAINASKVIPQVGQVGWDICVSEKGPCIVEGNNWNDYMFFQLPEHNPNKIGLMPFYNDIMSKIKK